MTIQIPDDLARGLEGFGAAEKKTAEQVALDRLRSLFDKPASPPEILRAVRALRHPSASAVENLDATIAASRLPVRAHGVFDR